MIYSEECGARTCFDGARPLCGECDKKRKTLDIYAIYWGLRKMHEDCTERGGMGRLYRNGFYLRLTRVGIGVYSLGINDEKYPQNICVRKRFGKYDFSKLLNVAKEIKEWIECREAHKNKQRRIS